MNLIIIFIILNIFNVIIQTANHLVTVNSGKWLASFSNAVAYGYYTVILVYMQCELPLIWKVIIVGGCNFIGVLIVKSLEQRIRHGKKKRVQEF